MWEIEKIIYHILVILKAYYYLVLSKFGMVDDEAVREYERKDKVCNKECPLHSSILGIGICSSKKEFYGMRGCGCPTIPKKWSDTDCPLNRF